MYFINNDTNEKYTLYDVFKDYNQFKVEEPYNHAETFIVEFLEIAMASINGRNDFDIIGLTGKEISNIIIKIRKKYIDNVEGEK